MFPIGQFPVPVLVPCADGPPAERRTREDDVWRSLVKPWLSESRANLDGHRSYFPSRSGSAGSSPRLVQVSLADALQHVVSGSLEPRDLIRQLPAGLRTILEKVAQDRYKKSLNALSSDECRALCGMLSGGFAGAATANAIEVQSFSSKGTDRPLWWRTVAWIVGLAAVALAAMLAAWRWMA